MIGRIAGALALVGTVLLICITECTAQPSGRVFHVGLLSAGSLAFYARELAAYREGMRALGYEEGRNLTVSARHADGYCARLPALATSLVAEEIDLYCAPTEPVIA